MPFLGCSVFIVLLSLVSLSSGVPVTTSANDKLKNATDEYFRYIEQMQGIDGKHPEVAESLKRLSLKDQIDNAEEEDLLWNSGYRNRPDEEKRIRIQQMLNEYNARLLQGRRNLNPGGMSQSESAQRWRRAMEEFKRWDQIEDDLYKRHKQLKRSKILKRLKEAYGAGHDQLLEELIKKEQHRKEHPKVHEPGSIPQLKEVDDLGPRDEFNPVLFHKSHDLNNDGVLDPNEIEAILQTELQNAYNNSSGTYDPATWDHELNNMRNHFLNSFDANKDMLVSLDEFVKGVSMLDVQRDDGWDPSFDEQEFAPDELEQFRTPPSTTTTASSHKPPPPPL